MASVVSIEGILFLNSESGARFYSKYYSPLFMKMKQSETRKFEKELFEHLKKTIEDLKNGSDADILSFKGQQVLVQKFSDFYVFILAHVDENELVVLDLMNCLNESLYELIRNRKTVLNLESLSTDESFPRFLSIIDQLIYEGAIVTLEPNQVIANLNMQIRGKGSSPQKSSEKSGAFSSIFGMAKNVLKRKLNSSSG